MVGLYEAAIVRVVLVVMILVSPCAHYACVYCRLTAVTELPDLICDLLLPYALLHLNLRPPLFLSFLYFDLEEHENEATYTF